MLTAGLGGRTAMLSRSRSVFAACRNKAFMSSTSSRYENVYRKSVEDPMQHWADAAKDITWFSKPEQILDDSRAPFFYNWFTGGTLNTCYNCLDVHIEKGKGDQAAIIYDSPVTNTVKTYTYKDVLAQVSLLAAAMLKKGVTKGDRVLVYMPMVPEAAFVMMACARIGAVHSVVFGGFASHELVKRIDDAQPKMVFTASCGIEGQKILPYMPIVQDAIKLARHPPTLGTVVLQRKEHPATLAPKTDIDWNDFVSLTGRSSGVDCVSMLSTDPLYILYTSGTTGMPKGVVRDNGGHAVALKWTMSNIFDINAKDVFWAASDIGWVVGHSYTVYAPLLKGATTVIYEGKPVGTPDAGAFWRVVGQHKVRTMFTAPTALRAIKKEDPTLEHVKKYDLGGFKSLYLAGERADPDTVKWASNALKRPVLDHWWQTETGHPVTANPSGLGLFPVIVGSAGKAMPGYNLASLDEQGVPVPAGTTGNLVFKLPLPPGALPTLWNNDERFVSSYLKRFPGYYDTADAGYIDKDNYVYVMARTDDVMNVAGHRLSTGSIEEYVSTHPLVAETAVIGAADKFKGQVPVIFVVVKNSASVQALSTLEKELISIVRANIGAVSTPRSVIVVQRLPKTRSGKVLRATMRSIADGKVPKVPATIEDPAVLEEIKLACEKHGLGIEIKE